jgi:hypothetical protein
VRRAPAVPGLVGQTEKHPFERTPPYVPPGWPRACRFPDCAVPGTFDSPDAAALAGFDYLSANNVDWTQYEYAGCVFKVALRYRASLPAALSPAHPRLCMPPSAPAGTTLVADYHNHTSAEAFSEDPDKTSHPSIPHYLLTPSGKVLRYTPADGQVTRLR